MLEYGPVFSVLQQISFGAAGVHPAAGVHRAAGVHPAARGAAPQKLKIP
jgi:hypothetical protein